MNLNKLFSILCVLVILTTCVSASAMTTSDKEGIYNAAVQQLEVYLESYGNSSAELAGIAGSFAELRGYEQSTFLGYYVTVLMKIADKEYDYELFTILNMLEQNTAFNTYLKEALKGSAICSVEELVNYAAAREYEHNGNESQAVDAYSKCLNFFDSAIRYTDLLQRINERKYNEAQALLKDGNYAGAYYKFSEIPRFSDSTELMASIVSQLGYTPESATDNLQQVSGLQVANRTETSITLSWNPANHAKAYEVFFKVQSQSDWTQFCTIDQTSVTIGGLMSDSYYDFKVISTINRLRAKETELVGEKTGSVVTPSVPPTTSPTVQPISTPARIPSSVNVGDIVKMGYYPQTSSGNDKTPIEWIVLDTNRSDSSALLISRYLLDVATYSDNDNSTWENSSLRKWLNGSFLNTAFTAEEKQAIMEKMVDNSKSQGNSTWNVDGGNNTWDKLFVLSYAEANKYFGFNGKGQCVPTDYAYNKALVSDTERVNGKATGIWWLRSPGFSQSTAMYVLDTGAANRPIHLTQYGICVRPALWVDLNAGIF